MEKLASIDTCSSSCMDAASGSPSATRAIIVSEIIPREDGTQRRKRSALTGSVNFKKLCVFRLSTWLMRRRMVRAEVPGAPLNKDPGGN